MGNQNTTITKEPKPPVNRWVVYTLMAESLTFAALTVLLSALNRQNAAYVTLAFAVLWGAIGFWTMMVRLPEPPREKNKCNQK